MGNAIGKRKKTVQIMKIDGEKMKFKVPIQAGDIVKDYPGHVLLDSEAVKHYGIRAKPIDAQRHLDPKRLYFLVELPQLPPQATRRVMSSTGFHMSAKDRLESLMLARRSASDLTIIKPSSASENDGGTTMRVRMKLPKAEVETLMKESRDEAEVAKKIFDLCVTARSTTSSPPFSSTSLSSSGPLSGSSMSSSRSSSINSTVKEEAVSNHDQQSVQRRNRDSHKKKVAFLPVTQGEIRQAVAS